MCIYIYVCMCVYIYIYIERERGRKRERERDQVREDSAASQPNEAAASLASDALR